MWRRSAAELRTGAHHLAVPPKRAHFGSPFAYGEQARVFIVRDVARRDPAALSAAYRDLFLAAGGGALGLFTAVRTLKLVAARLRARSGSAACAREVAASRPNAVMVVGSSFIETSPLSVVVRHPAAGCALFVSAQAENLLLVGAW